MQFLKKILSFIIFFFPLHQFNKISQRQTGEVKKGGKKSITNITNDCAKNSINYAYYLLSLSSNKCFIISPAHLMLGTFAGAQRSPGNVSPHSKCSSEHAPQLWIPC